jgi:hypothetical protein
LIVEDRFQVSALKRAMSATPRGQIAPRPSFAPPGAMLHPPELPALATGATHLPDGLHTLGATQSATEVHVVAHSPVPCTQAYGEQSDDDPASPATPVVEVWESEQTDPPLGLQAPPAQSNPDAQSPVVAQLVLHAVPTHAKLPGHGLAASGAQVPVPSHAPVTISWSLHEVVPHVVPDAAYWQVCCPPLAVQVAPHAAPAPAHAFRWPCGSPFTCEHRPCVAATSHAWHCPVHAVLQQTPSTQKPVMHWSPAVQAAPFSPVLEHNPSTQWSLTHWSSAVQLVAVASLATQWPPLQ